MPYNTVEHNVISYKIRLMFHGILQCNIIRCNSCITTQCNMMSYDMVLCGLICYYRTEYGVIPYSTINHSIILNNARSSNLLQCCAVYCTIISHHVTNFVTQYYRRYCDIRCYNTMKQCII